MDPQRIEEVRKHTKAIVAMMQAYSIEHQLCIHEITAIVALLSRTMEDAMHKVDSMGLSCEPPQKGRYDA